MTLKKHVKKETIQQEEQIINWNALRFGWAKSSFDSCIIDTKLPTDEKQCCSCGRPATGIIKQNGKISLYNADTTKDYQTNNLLLALILVKKKKEESESTSIALRYKTNHN